MLSRAKADHQIKVSGFRLPRFIAIRTRLGVPPNLDIVTIHIGGSSDVISGTISGPE